MNMNGRISPRTAALVVVALAAYLGILQIGFMQHRTAERIVGEAGPVSGEALRGWAYAQTHDGVWPPLDTTRHAFSYPPGTRPESYTFGGPAEGPVDDSMRAYLFGHLNRDRAMRLKPVLSSDDYFYLGYAVTSDEGGLALAEAVRNGLASDEDFSVGPGQGTLASSKLYRLRNDLADHMIHDGAVTDPEKVVLAHIPVVIQRPKGSYAWVVFLDFHIECLPYPGVFPASERFIKAMESTGQ